MPLLSWKIIFNWSINKTYVCSYQSYTNSTTCYAAMTECIVISLPEVLSKIVLVDWLRLNEVVKMDTAFCTRQLRPSLLATDHVDMC
jgi:hypothetical protein